MTATPGIRINKYISETGLCSRREADELVELGSVQINGRVAVMGDRVGPDDQVKVRGKLLTRYRPEDDSLTLHDVPRDEREMLIAADPAVFHTTPHYRDYPIVLARLATMPSEVLLRFLERRSRGIAPKRLVKEREGGMI